MDLFEWGSKINGGGGMIEEDILECGLNAIVLYDAKPCVVREIRKVNGRVVSVVVLVLETTWDTTKVGVRIVPRSDFGLLELFAVNRIQFEGHLRFVHESIGGYLYGDPADAIRVEGQT